ncbi:hypothetical protein ACYBD3_06935 [Klebsiella pneumoniae]
MTSKLTRDQLRERAQLKAKNLTYAISQSAFAGVRSELEEELHFLQCALACLEGVNSEPVAKVEAVGVCWYADNGLPRKPAVGTELFSTPSAPVCIPTFEEWCERTEQKPVGWVRDAMKEAYNACRATMLQASPVCTCPSGDGSLRWPCPVHAGSSPVIPDGYVLVPMRLTAENGAKGALSGEFSETKFVNCPECFGDDECETCDGSGKIEITVPVTWTTIKAIWVKGVEHFTVTAQEND